MENVLTLTNVPLKSLRMSSLNVRRTNRSEDIESLAADIRDHGLKQNLVVVPSEEPGRWEVVAGGRRYLALLKLVHNGNIAVDAPIPVRVEERAQGRPTSLSENIHRVAMNPVDKFIAYREIVEGHKLAADPIVYCADRFGVSRAHVEGRLRLAALAPEILDALREKKLSVDSAKAYAVIADHALQLQVFQAEERKTWGSKHDPRAVRDSLRSKTLPLDCAQAVYVGLQAYIDAGGRLEPEMFMGADGAERIVDIALIDQLAKEKAAAELPVIAKKEGFGEVLLARGFGNYPDWPKAPAGLERDRAYQPKLEDLAKKDRKTSVGVFRLSIDGTGLIYEGRFKPAPAKEPQPQGARLTYEQRERLELIRTRAAVFALPDYSGTPLDGLLKIEDDAWLEPVDDDGITEEGVFYLLARIRVTEEQLEQHRAEAEAAIARDEAEAAAREAAEAANATEEAAA